MHPNLASLPALMWLAACASPATVQPTAFIEPDRIETVRTHIVPVPHTVMPREKARRDATGPREATRQANKDGLVVPNPRDFIGAHYTPPYVKDFWYEVYAAAGDGQRQPPNQTDIELQPGEVLYSIAAPDNALWSITSSYYGEGAERTYVVHAKPRRPHVSMQTTLLTDRRKYTLNLRSFRTDKHVMVSWSYPAEELAAVNAKLAADRPREDGGSLHVLPACRNARYRIEGASVSWRPVATPEGLPSVCDDGRHVRINFPPNLGAIAAPALFQADSEDGDNARLVNYRILNSCYVVDGTPRVLLLRLGADTVTLIRGG